MVIKEAPSEAAPYERRAFAYRNLKKYPEAIADYTKMIALKPTDPDGYRHRAYVYSVSGEPQKAMADYHAVLKIKPDDADAQSRLKALEARPSSSPVPNNVAATPAQKG